MNHPDYSDAVQQAFNDWNDGSAYLDNGGNYRVRTRDYSGYLSPGGKIAPWNREVKRLFAGNGEFHRAAKEFKETAMNQTTRPLTMCDKGTCGHDSHNSEYQRARLRCEDERELGERRRAAMDQTVNANTGTAMLDDDHNFVPQDDYYVRLCGICGFSKAQHQMPQPSDPGEPRRAGAGHDFTDWSVFYSAPAKGEYPFQPRCYIMAKSATYGECRVFDVPDPDETQRAAAADACRALNNFATLVEALAQTLQVMRNLRGKAFVGSRTPRDREPLLKAADEAERVAVEALARARQQG